MQNLTSLSVPVVCNKVVKVIATEGFWIAAQSRENDNLKQQLEAVQPSSPG